MAQSSDATANNTEDEEHPNVNGEPLACPKCGQYVVDIHRSENKYGAHDVGFSPQCDCAFGGEIGRDVTEDFWGGWIADRIAEDMLDYYLNDELAENWRGDDDGWLARGDVRGHPQVTRVSLDRDRGTETRRRGP